MRLKKLSIIILVLLLFIGMTGTVSASESGINAIDITVLLNPDGSAYITQVWDIDNVYDGSEYYIALENLDNMTVSGLRVSDDSGREYDTLDIWDTSASFGDKAYKCGILETDDGYEICWGISQTGDRVYTVSYLITELVKAYSDGDGFYFQFISDKLSSQPDSATVTVYMDGTEFSRDNAQIWTFGFEGEIQFEDGAIVARSDNSLGSDDYVNLLCGFDAGLFDAVPAEGTFEDVKEEALNGDEMSFIEVVIILSAIVGVLLVAVLIIFLATRNIRLSDGNKAKSISQRKVEINMTVPFRGSIPMTCCAKNLYHTMGFSGNAIAAYLTRWELDGVISYETETCNKGKRKKEDSNPIICLTGREPETDAPGRALFSILKRAANGGALWLSAWQSWAEKNAEVLSNWNKDLEKFGNKQLVEAGWAAKNEKGRILFTPMGYEKALQMLGFNKYLSGFSKEKADMAAPREYWGEYLVFASLFGISENVANGFKTIDPEGFDDFSYEYGIEPILFLNFIAYSSTFSNSALPSGGDGSSGGAFSSGGGGFSGGGGGGSR